MCGAGVPLPVNDVKAIPSYQTATPQGEPAMATPDPMISQRQMLIEQQERERMASLQAAQFQQNEAQKSAYMQMLNSLTSGYSGEMVRRRDIEGNELNLPKKGEWNIRMKKPSTCNTPVNSMMMNNFRSCMQKQNSSVQTYKSLVMDAASRIGYVVSPEGDILECYTITIGKNGIGNDPSGQTGKTETGFFYSQPHEGEKYQTSNSNYESKSIGIGEPYGKVLHSDHQNNATLGCIGIEQAKWRKIFDSMKGQGWGAPIYVWTKEQNSCNPSPGTGAAPARTPAPQGGVR